MARFIECDRGMWVNLDHVTDIQTLPLNDGTFLHQITLVGKGYAEKTTKEPVDWRAKAADCDKCTELERIIDDRCTKIEEIMDGRWKIIEWRLSRSDEDDEAA